MDTSKLEEFKSVVLTTGTSQLSIYNQGADDKHEIALHFHTIKGDYKQYKVLTELKKGDKKVIPLKDLNVSIRDFAISWEDDCARIRRFTAFTDKAGKGYRNIDCEWVSIPQTKTEENYVAGD